jgi:hypothetical protein
MKNENSFHICSTNTYFVAMLAYKLVIDEIKMSKDFST